MKGQRVSAFVSVVLLAAVVAGCATMGYDQAGKLASSMRQTRQDVVAAGSQITATFNALDVIMMAQVGDLRPLVTQYSKELAGLDKAAKDARTRGPKIQTSGDAYFASWAQEIEAIQDPGLRASSKKRREETMADYQAVVQSLNAVRDAYAPVIKEARDIEKVLQQDLTKSGVAAAQQGYTSARQKATVLQGLMTQSLGVIDQVVTDLAPTPER